MGVGPVIINAISTLHLIFQAWQRNQLLMNFLEVTMTPLLLIKVMWIDIVMSLMYVDWNFINTRHKEILQFLIKYITIHKNHNWENLDWVTFKIKSNVKFMVNVREIFFIMESVNCEKRTEVILLL